MFAQMFLQNVAQGQQLIISKESLNVLLPVILQFLNGILVIQELMSVRLTMTNVVTEVLLI
jgi:hypothetical protein